MAGFHRNMETLPPDNLGGVVADMAMGQATPAATD
jgi:hypothetical protein